MFNSFLLRLATFFGVGKVPKAPGTIATLATIPLWFILAKLGVIIYMGAVVALALLGILAAEAYEKKFEKPDNQEIVIDEVVGYLITMTWLPLTWQSALIGFVVFRALDIFKPWPISFFDKKVKGGLGVMADDLVAGIIGSILMQFIYNHTYWLGSQISILTAP
jgi:phosphatidylglycerophosphatase A